MGRFSVTPFNVRALQSFLYKEERLNGKTQEHPHDF